MKLATVWLGGCSGCHMSFLDLDEALIELAGKVEIVFSPLVDAKQYPQGVDLALVEGAVCNSDHFEMALKIRHRTRCLVALGDCAVTGNVSALRNPLGPDNAQSVLQRAYRELADVQPQIPRADGLLPVLLERALPLHEIVPVDYYLPGCPPPAGRIRWFLDQWLSGKPPVLSGADIRFG